MSLPRRCRRRLRRIRRTLRASDPHLWAMLVIFARLTAGENMPAWEQVRRKLPRAVRGLARAASAAVRLGARVLLAGGHVLQRAAMRSRHFAMRARHAAMRSRALHRREPRGFGSRPSPGWLEAADQRLSSRPRTGETNS